MFRMGPVGRGGVDLGYGGMDVVGWIWDTGGCGGMNAMGHGGIWSERSGTW